MDCRIEGDQKTATSVYRIEKYEECTRILITSLFTGPIRGGSTIPALYFYDRFGMNKTPHRLRWQWGVVFRRRWRLNGEGKGWVSGEPSLLALKSSGEMWGG